MAELDPPTPPTGDSNAENDGAPRINPPEGQRFARGQAFEPDYNDGDPVDGLPKAPSETEELESADLDSEDLESGEFAPPSLPVTEPDNLSTGHYKPYADPNTPLDKELGLFEHLAELRSRLIKCVAAVCLGMLVTWNWGLPLQNWFAAPILLELKKSGGKPISTDPTGFFTVYFQFSLVSSLILTMPVLIYQLWKFIEPALTTQERRYGIVLIPFSVTLFAMGTALGYVMSPFFYQFFLAFQPKGVAAQWDYYQSLVLQAKMLLCFGVTFQVPVVTIFLNKVGLVSRNWLIEYWRHAVVLIYLVVAIITPTWDPISLFACATPPCLLYILSIWIIKWL